MKKKSIIFIIPDMEMGGAERITLTLANHLPREKFSIKIMLMRKKGAYLNFLREDIEIIDLKTERIRNSLLPILKEIRKRKPDIIFSGYGEVNAYLSLFIKFFRKTKFIARETNVVSQHVQRKEIKFFYQFYHNYNKIIAQSDDMKLDLIQNFRINPNKIEKINNPVDFNFIEEKIKVSHRPENYQEGFKHVVSIGNLSERKGFDNLLKVFSFLKNEKIKLHIIGDGRDRELLLNMKNNLGLENVIFHGQQNNPYPFLYFSDLFVLSSRYEGFPNVLLEAGACGVYSIANNCPGGISEIIIPNVNGEIFPIEKHEEFSEKIKELLLKDKDSKKIKESIKSRFSKDFILKKYEQTLDSL